MEPEKFDVVILGAGAAGLMCALTAGRRGKSVLLLERNKKPGAKILISGGGRCNFTNIDANAGAYLSENPHFAKSALSRFSPWDFVDMLAQHDLTWHEKTLGQLFCDQGSKAVLNMLLAECRAAGVELRCGIDVSEVSAKEGNYSVYWQGGCAQAPALVVATGGVSIPKMGATDYAYRLAQQFGLGLVPAKPALVPFTFGAQTLADMKALAGVSADSIVRLGSDKTAPSFRENILFTHRGLSGPAILQISSYWQPGGVIEVNLAPDNGALLEWLKEKRQTSAAVSLKSVLASLLPTRLADQITGPVTVKMAELSNKSLEALAQRLSAWSLVPTGTEGFAKAEVTAGGVSTADLSSKTMEAKGAPGLYFIGESVDVTGWLGGYNFQWGWASGSAAGNAV